LRNIYFKFLQIFTNYKIGEIDFFFSRWADIKNDWYECILLLLLLIVFRITQNYWFHDHRLGEEAKTGTEKVQSAPSEGGSATKKLKH